MVTALAHVISSNSNQKESGGGGGGQGVIEAGNQVVSVPGPGGSTEQTEGGQPKVEKGSIYRLLTKLQSNCTSFQFYCF